MKDPDQPEPDDPRRKEYDFQQAMAAQRQMASGTFGNHHSAILPADNSQGDSKKSRLEAMISDAVKSAVTQITTNVAGVVQSFDNAPAKELPVTLQPDAVQQFRQQDVMQPQVAQPQAVQQQPQVVQPAGGPRAEPVFVQQPAHRTEPSHYQTPQMPEAPAYSGASEIPPPPSHGEIDVQKFATPPTEPRGVPLQALEKMAPYERPVEEIRASTIVQKTGPDAQAPPAAERRQAPRMPENRSAFAPLEPFVDPGGKTADPPKSSRQSSEIDQASQMSEAMDEYGIVMAEFTEAVTESIRTLTRRVNDMTRAIQGEGHDIR